MLPPSVDKEELTQLLQDLVRLPSVNPPGKEALVADYLTDWARREGFDVTSDEVMPGRPNVYITLGGNAEGPRLLFNTHMDVVPEGSGWFSDPFGGQIIGDKLYGRGSADTKGSLAAMLLCAKTLRTNLSSLKGSLTIAAVCDEEDAGKGTLHSLAKGLTADFAIVGEPTELKVVTAAKGSVTFQISIRGKAAHSSVPKEGVNAICKMSHIIHRLEDYSNELSARSNPLLGCPTVSVDVIEGGSSPWIVPESCKIIIDRRTLPGENEETVQRELKDLLTETAKDDPELVYELKNYQNAPAAQVGKDEPIARIALDEVARATGLHMDPSGLSGTTDARFLINESHIPTIIFGPGSLSLAHQANEYVSINEVHLASIILSRIAAKTLSR